MAWSPDHYSASTFPLGLPFALGTTGIFATAGWRIMYGIGSLLALIGLLLRVELPESPRWLASKGRIMEASKIVERMEEAARKKIGELPPVPQHIEVKTITEVSYKEALRTILGNRVYLKRWIIVMSMWFFGYITVYTNAAGLTTILSSLGYPSSEAGMIASLGILGFVAVPVLLILFGDRLERKVWVPISAVIMLLGGAIMAEAGHNFFLEVLGHLFSSSGITCGFPSPTPGLRKTFPQELGLLASDWPME